MRTYDPGQVYASIGAITLDGFAEGTFIEIERMASAYSSTAGAQGEVARVRSRDRRGKIKITLLQTSPINGLLSNLAGADESSNSGVGRFHLRDGSGSTVVSATNCWIEKRANPSFGKEHVNREWNFECEFLEIFDGGND